MSRQQRILLNAVLGITLVWVIVLGGRRVAEHFRVTPEKISARAASLDMAALSEAERVAEIDRIAAMIAALDRDDRRSSRGDAAMLRWFDSLTETEKARFLEQTMPSGFKRMIDSFEELPPDKRRRALDDATKRMREAQAESRDPAAAMMGQSREEAAARPISAEVRQAIMETGLNTFYRESSAATKAEVMPLLEELQRAMQTGRYSR